jgi:phospholipase/lecithinase/hemolysin
MFKKMGCQWTKRLVLATAFTLLAACGSGSKYEEFIPTRIVSAGDQLSYLGNSALTPAYSDRFTVNNLASDTAVNNWVLQLAASYGLNTDLSRPDPAVVGTADPVNNKVANLEAQIATVTPRSGDMLVVNGGMADIIALAEAVATGTKTSAQALSEISAAGSELQAILLRQLSRYKNILVINAYDLKNSPYASGRNLSAAPTMTRTAFQQLLQDMTRAFNTALIRNAGTFASGTGIRLFDAETWFLNANLYNIGITAAGLSSGTCNSFAVPPPETVDDNSTRVACTTTAAAALNASYDTYLFADNKFPTPVAHRFLGTQAYTFLRSVKGW